MKLSLTRPRLSMIEMFAGVICVCMPSVSKVSHDYYSSFQTLRSRLSSSFSFLNRSKMRQYKTNLDESRSKSQSEHELQGDIKAPGSVRIDPELGLSEDRLHLTRAPQAS